MARNILIKIEYDGTNFFGWQRQKDKRTVCGCLEDALAKLIGTEIKIDGTSRTDAGVHALGQCASFTLPDGGIPTDRIPKALNDLLAEDRLEGLSDVRILSAKEMPEGFHARYSCKGKRYIYKIFCSKQKSIFRRTRFFQIEEELDIDAMRRAAEYIVGTHDFASFETSGSTSHETTVRTIYSLKLTEKKEDTGKLIELSIEGDGFLYNMVRIITGTLVEVGLGKIKPEEIENIVASLDRGKAGFTAPPQGLYLDEIFY